MRYDITRDAKLKKRLDGPQIMIIFENVSKALRARYTVESVYPDCEGMLHARIYDRPRLGQSSCAHITKLSIISL